jgi:hypothetical protein
VQRGQGQTIELLAIEFPFLIAACAVVMVAVKCALSQFFDFVLRGLRASAALVISAQP